MRVQPRGRNEPGEIMTAEINSAQVKKAEMG